MSEFEARLSECLDALLEGRWDIDECLRRYPKHADALRPALLAALASQRAFQSAAPQPAFARDARERFLIATGQRIEEAAREVQPDPVFAAEARERYLVATGERLRDALDLEPAPTFFAAARVRFLMAAHKLRQQRDHRHQPRRVPLFGSPARALAGGLAVVALFLGFSTYTVATADAALPRDCQYPVKLQTELVRLALAFSDGAKRDVKLDLAEERVHEIEEMTRRGRQIGPGTLERLVKHTEPLIDEARDWPTDDVARLRQVAEREKQVLAAAAPHVDADAAPQLDKAVDVSQVAIKEATELIVREPSRPPTVVPPVLELTATPTPTATATTPAASATPEEGTPAASATPAATEQPRTPTSEVVIDDTPVATRDNVPYYEVRAGHLVAFLPGAESGWHLVSEGTGGVPTLLRYANSEGTSIIAISTLTGDMYWYIAANGKIDEVQMRITRDGSVLVQDRGLLLGAYGRAAAIPLAVMDSITIVPDPTPTPHPTNTGTAIPTVVDAP